MNNYDWIIPGVHAWVEGLVCPVEVEVEKVASSQCFCLCGVLYTWLHFNDLYQTEAECLEVMRSKAPNLQN